MVNRNRIVKETKVALLEDVYVHAPCGYCKNVTRAKVLARVDLDGREFSGTELVFGWDDTMEVIQCQGCEELMFKKSHVNSEDMYHTHGEDGYEGHYVTTEEYFPNPEQDRVAVQDDHLLPVGLRRIYLETVKALNEDSPVLAGIGIRAIVETICKDKNAEGRGLDQKINSLVEVGVLTPGGAEVLHKVRTLGNRSAHEVEPHNSASLGLAMDVVEHLIQGVYILPHHAQQHLD